MAQKMLRGIPTKSYVVEGATLGCSMGIEESRLQLPEGHGVYIRGKKQANTDDFKPVLNICSFGTCKMSKPPVPCVPVVAMGWLNGKEDIEIDGQDALVDSSLAFCSLGGIIKITGDGQMG